MEIEKKKFEEMLKKAEELRKSGSFDLSMEEDLSIAVMNLVSIEEHLFFTASKTKDSKYLDILNEARGIRKELLGKMIPINEGESWCISKHLLAAAMRIMEVGTKLLSENKKEEAEKMFQNAYHLYSAFWGIRLKLIDVSAGDKSNGGMKGAEENGAKKPWTVEDIVEKLVDCCKE
ncbi:hypothetical protein A3I34_01285 [Candidatus Jorgensenbacteria bacterium RIFCSPLOWO2_02_FULL_45_12]|uniref:Uncharacterized protein n=2 Tax=Candidatus Joergenseniibacteriota TaxID=1752739 RepID=A0A1F6BQ22_9BACT|nr:MAG: hypothetical protein UX22_C0001G0042 [Candidatus Jorgensenbacteria bacterium GW2011_GWA2_45_9]OGG38968.1 MAG: hypothetical protein A3D55_03075 [Candidatus Jorgensenbacteria bacterium RIFCSPHIGHO2_02_FULL_45_20]OGG42727.1 MAG: hypothetical protein A3I34_01285 [Candidatus Jorgensenbacteria bacterium RIFCSPLOWO2_02_FULL_45_12]